MTLSISNGCVRLHFIPSMFAVLVRPLDELHDSEQSKIRETERQRDRETERERDTHTHTHTHGQRRRWWDSPLGSQWRGPALPALPPWCWAKSGALVCSDYPCWTHISERTQDTHGYSRDSMTVNNAQHHCKQNGGLHCGRRHWGKRKVNSIVIKMVFKRRDLQYGI